MPNRLIREGLFESEAVLSVPVEARWLFVIIILSADDLGLFEATEFKLARRADVRREMATNLLQMLADAGLIRLYEVPPKRYGFIPKFRQRLQIKRSKFPLPPIALMQDDDDAVKKINDLASNTTVVQQMDSGCAAGGHPSEPEPEEEKEISTASQSRQRRKAADPIAACPYQSIVDLYHDLLPELPAVVLIDSKGRKRLILDFWKWVLTSEKRDHTRRATTADEALTWIRAYFERARANDFVMGRTEKSGGHKNWRADIDYLMTERGRKQVIEKTQVVA